MTFSSIEFLIFFFIIIIIMASFNIKFVRKNVSEEKIKKIKHYILLVASYIFYGWWDYRFCLLMFIMTFIAFYCAKKVEEDKNKKIYSFISISVPLLFLGVFKYFNFFIESFCTLFNITNVTSLNIILPVGISFYTFQSISYTIDVIRKDIKSQSFLNVALYISFFPQLVAGPIVKASDFLPQLEQEQKISLKNICIGIQIFVFGLFKKIVIADNLSVFVDDVFNNPNIFSWYTIILAVISYSIQIYFDFSGYSDMAVGTAKCLGYDFKKNFDVPYLSRNVSEFWKRWHISLSSWLQQYLYIPLGGNRRGKVRTYINLILTMVLGGLWHGANINFVIWGLLHGVALCVHKIYKKFRNNKKESKIGNALSIFATYVYVCFCWIFFRATSLSDVGTILTRIFMFEKGITQIFSWSIIAIIILIIGEIYAHVKSKKNNSTVEGFYVIMDLTKAKSLIILFTFIGIILGLAYTNSNPFIYFQF
ncbi:MAG: MBOAT family protein [Clostridia bacterium]|nr:MBOAT family protein [Clostridia bacterium]